MLLLVAAPAWAGRKIVVLEFEGPKAERFHDDVEAAIEKAATVVSLDKWMAKAEDLDATKVNARNIKKVARKLKVDGVVMGEVEKRGQRYYVHLKLREGISGEYVAEVEIVVRSPKLGNDGAKTIKEELIPAIKDLMSISGDDDDDDADEDDDEDDDRAKRRKKGFGGGGDDDDEDADSDDDEDDRAAAKAKAKKDKAKKEKLAKEKAAKEKAAKEKAAKDKAKKDKARKQKEQDESDDEDEEAVTSHFGDDDDDEDEDRDDEDRDDDDDDGDDDDRVADRDDDDDDDDDDGKVRRRSRDDDEDDGAVGDPRSRAVDVSAGMSVTARRLGFTTTNGTGPVQGYTGNPVAGVVVAGSVYPLAFNKKNRSLTRDLGLTLLFDRVVKISSKIKYDDMGTEETAVLGTTQQRFSFGVVFRHSIGDKAAIIGSVRFNKMKFVIDKGAAPAGVVVQIPNVDYTFIDPGVAVKYVATPKIVVDAGVSVGLVLDTGEMQQADQFGTSKVLGIDFTGGGSYAVTDKLMIRAEVRATTFGFEFTGNGAMNDLDGDGTGDVPSGRDTYFGALAAAGYIF